MANSTDDHGKNHIECVRIEGKIYVSDRDNHDLPLNANTRNG